MQVYIAVTVSSGKQNIHENKISMLMIDAARDWKGKAYLNQPIPKWVHNIIADWTGINRTVLQIRNNQYSVRPYNNT